MTQTDASTNKAEGLEGHSITYSQKYMRIYIPFTLTTFYTDALEWKLAHSPGAFYTDIHKLTNTYTNNQRNSYLKAY